MLRRNKNETMLKKMSMLTTTKSINAKTNINAKKMQINDC